MSLDELIAKVRKLGTLPTEIARAAAPLVEAESKRSAAAGETPFGDAWKPRKDGSRALANAAAAVTVAPVGSNIRISLVGTSTGSAKVQSIQNAARPIIPKHTTQKGGAGQGLPPGLEKAMSKAANDCAHRVMT
jgi:hypothetical protein